MPDLTGRTLAADVLHHTPTVMVDDLTNFLNQPGMARFPLAAATLSGMAAGILDRNDREHLIEHLAEVGAALGKIWQTLDPLWANRVADGGESR
jgi:hypothetical protein